MAVNKTGAKAKKFIKPSYIVATLFTGSEQDDLPKMCIRDRHLLSAIDMFFSLPVSFFRIN